MSKGFLIKKTLNQEFELMVTVLSLGRGTHEM